jgi:hypothetical protein
MWVAIDGPGRVTPAPFFCAMILVLLHFERMTYPPVGFRPRPDEIRAIKRAQLELGIDRSTLLRTALRDLIDRETSKGTLSRAGTAAAFKP